MPKPRACKKRPAQDQQARRNVRGTSAGLSYFRDFPSGNKKSLRIRMKENKIGSRITYSDFKKLCEAAQKKKKANYVWPRTVEATKDPFTNNSGKNKMFYLIAIDLFPTHKIIVPSDSESDGEESPSYDSENASYVETPEVTPSPEPVRRRGRRPNAAKRQLLGGTSEQTLTWRGNNESGKIQDQVIPMARAPTSGRGRFRIADEEAVMQAINCVVGRYQKKYGMPVTYFKPIPLSAPESTARSRQMKTTGASEENSAVVVKIAESPLSVSGDEEVEEPLRVSLDLD